MQVIALGSYCSASCNQCNIVLDCRLVLEQKVVFLVQITTIEQVSNLLVEGRHGVLFTSNCLLLVGKSSSRCLGLSICVSGGFL